MKPALSPPRRRPLSALLFIVPILLTAVHAAPSVPPPPLHLALRPSRAHLSRGVDDVGPAFTNATQTALTKAKSILTRYSTTLRVIAIPTGLAVTFFGYVLLGPVLFLAGFVSGGAAAFVAVNAALGDSTPAAAWLSIAATVLAGAMLGFLALRALSLGMFAIGAALGVVLASALKTSLIAQAYPKDPQLAFYIAAAVAGTLFGILAMCLQKQMLIFSTSYAGSCGAVFGIGHFAGHFPTTEEITSAEKGKLDDWVLFYVLLTIGLGTAGMFFQFWLARGKAMPTHAPRDRRRRRRRVRQYDPEDWSEDADWEDEIYADRAPPSRRKYEAVDRVDTQNDGRRQGDSFKAERGPSTSLSYPHGSWNNVRNAACAFREDLAAQECDVVSSPPCQLDERGQSMQVVRGMASPSEKIVFDGKQGCEVDVLRKVTAEGLCAVAVDVEEKLSGEYVTNDRKMGLQESVQGEGIAKGGDGSDKVKDDFWGGDTGVVEVALESDGQASGWNAPGGTGR